MGTGYVVSIDERDITKIARSVRNLHEALGEQSTPVFLKLGLGSEPTGTQRLYGVNPEGNFPATFDSYLSAGGSGGAFTSRTSRGTAASPSAVQAGDGFGAFIWGGQQSTTPGDFDNTVRIIGIAAENWSSGVNGSYILFEATPTGGTSRAEQFRVAGGHIFATGATTTASAANTFMNSGSSPVNELLRSTSSLRYKREVEPMELKYAKALLKLRPVWYRSTCDADNPAWSWYGFIAEEVDEVDPRLVHRGYPEEAWDSVAIFDDDVPARFDEHGNRIPDGYQRVLKPDAQLVPDGVAYDRMVVPLLMLVKDLVVRMERLERSVGGHPTADEHKKSSDPH